MTVDTLMQEQVLVMSQRGWLISDYGIFDEHGQQLAGARKGRQTMVRRQLEVVDQQDKTLLRLVRPVDPFGWHLTVTTPDGACIGKLVVRMARGLRLVIESRGRKLAELRADSPGRERFTITGPDQQAIAHLERQQEGLTSFRYTLRIHRPVPDPLRSLLVAVPLAVDIRFKQLSGRALAS